MQKIFLLKGLPASGKSTWARGYCGENPKTKRVNKDDLRAMISCKHTKGNESFVLVIRNSFIHHALSMGYDVIVDDTNFHPKHEDDIRVLALNFDAEVEIKEFDTPIEECIRRDSYRTGPANVGEEVIRRMAMERDKWKQSQPA